MNKKLPDGGYQYQSPVAAGRVGTERTMHTANQDATEYPSDLVYPEKYFNVPAEEAVRIQRTPWGTYDAGSWPIVCLQQWPLWLARLQCW